MENTLTPTNMSKPGAGASEEINAGSIAHQSNECVLRMPTENDGRCVWVEQLSTGEYVQVRHFEETLSADSKEDIKLL